MNVLLGCPQLGQELVVGGIACRQVSGSHLAGIEVILHRVCVAHLVVLILRGGIRITENAVSGHRGAALGPLFPTIAAASREMDGAITRVKAFVLLGNHGTPKVEGGRPKDPHQLNTSVRTKCSKTSTKIKQRK